MKKCLPKHLGARNELVACTWLLNEGYEVFRNVSQHGDVDLIAMRGGETLYLDAKAAPYTPKGKPTDYANRLRAAQIAAGVKRLNVYPDGHCAIMDDAVTLESALAPRHCPHCAESFTPTNQRQIYCQHKCTMAAWDAKRNGERVKRTYTKQRR